MRSSQVLLRQRAVYVTGARTPFVKSFGSFMSLDNIQLGTAAVGGLLKKSKLDPKELNHIVWGNVVLQLNASNCAREIAIDLNLSRNVTGHFTSMACATGLNAMTQAVMLIESGHADVVIAGGSDSMSNACLPAPTTLSHGLARLTMGKKKGLAALPGFFKEAGYNPLRWLPQPLAVEERSTGKTMGWHADMMAELNKISRVDQEALAITSHRNASEAVKKGYMKEEIVPTTVTKNGQTVEYTKDEYIRSDIEEMKTKLPNLKPSFRKPNGTITAATSSGLTDGGSAMLFMSEEKAKQLGYPTDVTLKAWHFSAIDPYPQLLLAPALGWGPTLKRAGLTAKDIDLFEIHEAFAAQVLATIKCLQSPEFFEKYTGSSEVVLKDKFDFSKLNVNGGAMALGHPFAATGGRLVSTLANELRRSGKRHGLISICAAGGLGGIAILEHTPKRK